jgi:hypothetical protein
MGMSGSQEFARPSNESIVADLILRQAPDDEEDEEDEDDEDDGTKNDDADPDDNGYSE